jgi:hypothetical protein
LQSLLRVNVVAILSDCLNSKNSKNSKNYYATASKDFVPVYLAELVWRSSVSPCGLTGLTLRNFIYVWWRSAYEPRLHIARHLGRCLCVNTLGLLG